MDFPYRFFCRGCGESFPARRKTALYCGKTCAKRCERAKKPKLTNRKLGAAKAYKTKCDKLEERHCLGCRAKFFVNGNNRQKRFHSAQCMREAARFRNSLVTEWKESI